MAIEKETLFYLIGLLLAGIPLTLGSYICTTSLCDLPVSYSLLSMAIVFAYVVACFVIQGLLDWKGAVLVLVVYVLLVVVGEVMLSFLKKGYGVVIVWR